MNVFQLNYELGISIKLIMSLNLTLIINLMYQGRPAGKFASRS